MTGTHRYRTWLALPLALTLLLSLTACTDDPKPPSLPSLTPTTATPDASNTVGLSDREQIEALYTDFIIHYNDAQDLEQSERREFLAQWLVDPLLADFVDGANEQEADHERFEGRVKPRIFAVKLMRTTAKLDDCNDQSETSIKDTRNGKVVVGGESEPVWLTTKLKRTNKGWRIYHTDVKETSCVGR